MGDNRTSRYTWTGSTGRATIFRRERPFGQDEIFAIRVPVLEIGTEAGREVANLLPAAVDNMCDYLDRQDRRFGKEGQEGAEKRDAALAAAFREWRRSPGNFYAPPDIVFEFFCRGRGNNV